jgi:hypothetical protein
MRENVDVITCAGASVTREISYIKTFPPHVVIHATYTSKSRTKNVLNKVSIISYPTSLHYSS